MVVMLCKPHGILFGYFLSWVLNNFVISCELSVICMIDLVRVEISDKAGFLGDSGF